MDVEQEARNLGWLPQDEFPGDPAKWTDAETFLERGKQIMPILRANNRHLQAEVVELRGREQEREARLKKAEEALETFKEFHVENLKERLQETKRSLMQQLAEAKKDGDTEQEVVIQDQLGEVNQQIREAAKVEEKPAPKADETPKLHPVSQAWVTANASWYGKDPRKTGLADGIAVELRVEDPQGTKRTPEEYYAELDRRMAEALGEPSGKSKVSGARRGGGAEGGEEGTPAKFSALPRDVQEECNRQASKMVGEGKPFKDLAKWQEYFAKLY